MRHTAEETPDVKSEYLKRYFSTYFSIYFGQEDIILKLMTVRFAGFIETAFRIQCSVLSLITLSSLMFGHIWLAPTTAPLEKPRYHYFSFIQSFLGKFYYHKPWSLILDPTKAWFNKYPICIFSTGVRERRFAWFLARLWGSWRLLGLQSMSRELWPWRKISSRLCRRFLHIQLCSRTWSDQRPSANQMPWKSSKLTKTSLSSCGRKMVECKANGARASEKIRS